LLRVVSVLLTTGCPS